MASKIYAKIRASYRQELSRITETGAAWRSFLDFAAAHTEIPFLNQVVVHEQKPDAGLVLTREEWDARYGRTVSRGEKGIDVFDSQNPGEYERYFELSQTQPTLFAQNPVDWGHVASVDGLAETIAAEYGIEEDTPTMASAISAFARSGEDERLALLLSDVRETLPNESVVRGLLRASAEYIAGRRLGVDSESLPPAADFDPIAGLTPSVAGFLGKSASRWGAAMAEEARDISAGIESGLIDAAETRGREAAAARDSAAVSAAQDPPATAAGIEEGINDGVQGHPGNLRPHEDGVHAGAQAGDLRHDAAGGNPGRPLEVGGQEGRRDVVGPSDEDGEGRARLEPAGHGLREVRGAAPEHSGPREGDNHERAGLRLAEDQRPRSAGDIAQAIPSAGAVDAQRVDYDLASEPERPHEGPKQRCARNIAAIAALKAIESEGRRAAPAEQALLSGYVGWGGLADAFDESKAEWASENKRLKDLLTPEEYASARESTLSAFYTPNSIIAAMYSKIAEFGFKGGRIIEPACGTGRFIGMLPDQMGDSAVRGVELDSLSGRIAGQLYQTRSVAVRGYETVEYPSGSFDLAIGNVPFGNFSLHDPKYNTHHFSIHEYFFAKALDQVRAGGIVAFITSRYLLDKRDPSCRRYLAQRAELLGAVRLPDSAFATEAGTEAVSDIVFLRKREEFLENPFDAWVETVPVAQIAPAGLAPDPGDTISAYLAEHPENIAGEVAIVSGPWGPRQTCRLAPGQSLDSALAAALGNIEGEYEPVAVAERDEGLAEVIEADPDVPNYSYTVKDGKVYYRTGEVMSFQPKKPAEVQKIAALCELRDATRHILDIQRQGCSDSALADAQRELGRLYDEYAAKNGPISAKGTEALFRDDPGYWMICGLETPRDDNKTFVKSDLFTKRTVRPHVVPTHADTPKDALLVSLGYRGGIDLTYMHQLTGMTPDELTDALAGEIYLDPHTGKWQTASEYLSGNVRHKLAQAEAASAADPAFAANVEALKAVVPPDIPAQDITVELGATWVPLADVREFVYERFDTPYYNRARPDGSKSPYGSTIDVTFEHLTSSWGVSEKRAHRSHIVDDVYGTAAANAYQLLEDALNMKDTIIRKTVFDPVTWEEKRIVDREATMLAQSKQDDIKAAFRDWVFEDPQRRDRLVRIYNDRFNSIVPREFDGAALVFPGMSAGIELKDHQRAAIARELFGGNTLLYHVVGAGKTFEMVAASQEGKRLGLHSKSMFVVPNHLTGQTAAEYLRLYPDAKVMVATKRDFEKANRRRFCARIATGDWDAVVVGHSQFERIPMSVEYQQRYWQEQLDEATSAIRAARAAEGKKSMSVKQLERLKKSITSQLKKLEREDIKDQGITFEDLGVDKLFVDEAHYFKNLYVRTRLSNVAGVSTSVAAKSSDLYMKTRYLDRVTGGRGVVFATGTAISNSLVEVYTMQRYLGYASLKEAGLESFDAWASTFGKKVTSIELSPDGAGYRSKERFSKFHNLPELMAMFKQFADVKTADMLDLPTPTEHLENIACEPTDFQRDYVKALGKRSDIIHKGNVSPHIDNMLKITSEGRKLALDQRLIEPFSGDAEGSKINVAVDNIVRIWTEGKDQRTTQLVFCDLSTPRGANSQEFSVYDEMKAKLVERGIPEGEIAFIHDAENESARDKLFERTRQGAVRVLFGSTSKMGAGTNVQDRLIAIHNMDCPWRPADLEQRSGRIVRQGNMNDDVYVFRYVTKGTFDSYLYQIIENKQKFIGQVFTSKDPARAAEDIDAKALDYAEVKALCADNPLVKEKMELDAKLPKLRLLKRSWQAEQFDLQEKLDKSWPARIASIESALADIQSDIELAAKHPLSKDGFVGMTVRGVSFDSRAKAGEALIECFGAATLSSKPLEVGMFRGFAISVSYDEFQRAFFGYAAGAGTYKTELTRSAEGCVIRLGNLIDGLSAKAAEMAAEVSRIEADIEAGRKDLGKPFAHADELAACEKRISELNLQLRLDEADHVPIGSEEDERASSGKTVEFERQQLIQVNKARKAGMAPEAISVWAKPEIEWRTMQELREQIELGTDPNELAKYVDPENMMGTLQLGEVCQGIRDGIDVSKYARRNVSYELMRAARRGLERGVDITDALDWPDMRAALYSEMVDACSHGVNLLDYVGRESGRLAVSNVVAGANAGLDDEVLRYLGKMNCYVPVGSIIKDVRDGLGNADAIMVNDSSFSREQTRAMREILKSGIPSESARRFWRTGISAADMRRIGSLMNAGEAFEGVDFDDYTSMAGREKLESMLDDMECKSLAESAFGETPSPAAPSWGDAAPSASPALDVERARRSAAALNRGAQAAGSRTWQQ